MLVRSDDEIYEVDGSYLGPPGRYIGRFKYKIMLLFPTLFLPTMALLHWLGVEMGVLSIGLPFLICLRLTQFLSKYFSRQTPFLAVVSQFLSEIVAPRAGAEKTRVSMPTRVKHAGRWVAGIDKTVLPRPERSRALRRRQLTRTTHSEGGGHDDE